MFGMVPDMAHHDDSSDSFTHSIDVPNGRVEISQVPESDAAVIQHFEPAVRRYCRSRTRSPEDADDAVQDTFLRFIRRSEQAVRNNEAWLIRAAACACADINRRRQRDDERRSDASPLDSCYTRDDDERFSDDGAYSPERITVEQLTISALLRRLEPRERLVVMDLYLMGADPKQVARYLNVTPGNLRFIAFSARRHARAILRSMESTPAASSS